VTELLAVAELVMSGDPLALAVTELVAVAELVTSGDLLTLGVAELLAVAELVMLGDPVPLGETVGLGLGDSVMASAVAIANSSTTSPQKRRVEPSAGIIDTVLVQMIWTFAS
jgi:hypothetical protein